MSLSIPAFRDDVHLKQRLVDQVAAHIAAGELNRTHTRLIDGNLVETDGFRWLDGKGDAIGCILHGSNFEAFEDLGIPEVLAYLLDECFAHLPLREAIPYTQRWLEAIVVGSNLVNTYDAICAWQVEQLKPILPDATEQEVFGLMIELYKQNCVDSRQWRMLFTMLEQAHQSLQSKHAPNYVLDLIVAAKNAASNRARDGYDLQWMGGTLAHVRAAGVGGDSTAIKRARYLTYNIFAEKILELLAKAPVPSQAIEAV